LGSFIGYREELCYATFAKANIPFLNGRKTVYVLTARNILFRHTSEEKRENHISSKEDVMTTAKKLKQVLGTPNHILKDKKTVSLTWHTEKEIIIVLIKRR
jgi:hypothetical protein